MGFNASALSANTVKTFVDRLNKRNKDKTTWPPKRSAVQEDIANILGYASWHALNKALETPKLDALNMTPAPATPVPTSDKWALPVDLLVNTDVMWQRYDLSAHCLVWGDDGLRCRFFEQLAAHNPSRPMLLIQGTLALPVEQWAGERVLTMKDLEMRAIQPAVGLDLTTVSAEDLCSALDGNLHNNTYMAKELLAAVVGALIEQRNTGLLVLDFNIIFDHLNYNTVVHLSQNPDISGSVRHNLKKYLQSLPGYLANSRVQSQTLLDKHEQRVQAWAALQQIGVFKATNTPHLLIPKNDLRECVSYLDVWSTHNPGGLIVLDGLHSTSKLYEFLLTRLAVYKRGGVGVVIGAASQCDFPNTQMFAQIKERMKDSIILK